MLLFPDDAFLHYIASLQRNKKTKHDGKMMTLQGIIKS